MARLFVGELPIRWRRMSRGVLYYQQYDCFSKAYSGWQHTKHPKTKHYCSSVRKPPIISGLSLQKTSNSGSVLMSSCTDLYQIDTKQRRSRPSDRMSRAPGADRSRPQREFARAPLAASNSTDTTAFATGYIACTVHMSLNIALQTTWLCT